MSIEWWAVDDGYGIVGYSWKCQDCGYVEMFGDYWEDEVECEKCEKVFKNSDKPE